MINVTYLSHIYKICDIMFTHPQTWNLIYSDITVNIDKIYDHDMPLKSVWKMVQNDVKWASSKNRTINA